MENKLKKQVVLTLIFATVGLGVIISTYVEHGFSEQGKFGYMAGGLALIYGAIRPRLFKR